MWVGQALPHDTKLGNCRCEIVGRRIIFIWSLIHGSSWSGLIKVGPGVRHRGVAHWQTRGKGNNTIQWIWTLSGLSGENIQGFYYQIHYCTVSHQHVFPKLLNFLKPVRITLRTRPTASATALGRLVSRDNLFHHLLVNDHISEQWKRERRR